MARVVHYLHPSGWDSLCGTIPWYINRPNPQIAQDVEQVTCSGCISKLAKQTENLLIRPVNWNCPWCQGKGKAFRGQYTEDTCFYCQGCDEATP